MTYKKLYCDVCNNEICTIPLGVDEYYASLHELPYIKLSLEGHAKFSDINYSLDVCWDCLTHQKGINITATSDCKTVSVKKDRIKQTEETK